MRSDAPELASLSKLFVGVGLLTAIESNAAESPPLSSSQALLERRNITDLGADTCLQCELQTFGGGMG
jgi:hypothetical protein